MSDLLSEFAQRGWCKFDADQAILAWVETALPYAQTCLNEPEMQHWWRYQNTWFVGVNCLANDIGGSLENGPAIGGAAIDFIQQELSHRLSNHLDRAQVSVICPGYPKASSRDSDSAFRYRQQRDAAHVDGLLKEGKERYAREYHAYILAIGMNDSDAAASPFVVWDGSHQVIQQALSRELSGFPADNAANRPITDCYQEARKRIFETCQRVQVPLKQGEALVAHRLLLHGTATWQSNQSFPRMLCFFRPQTMGLSQWLGDL